VLTGLATIAIAGLRGDLSAMSTSAVGYFWIAAAPMFATIMLFLCNVIETQAGLYDELAEASASKILELESELDRHRKAPPDYDAWWHRETIELRTAASLWCDESPTTMKMSPKVQQWYNALAGAIQERELEFVPKLSDEPRLRITSIERQRQNPDLATEVTRTQLRKFAKLHGYNPKFLKD
jgi:hypothetical protein